MEEVVVLEEGCLRAVKVSLRGLSGAGERSEEAEDQARPRPRRAAKRKLEQAKAPPKRKPKAAAEKAAAEKRKAAAEPEEAQPTKAPRKSAPLTAEEAVAQAAKEELTLEPSRNAIGYKGVTQFRSCYQAHVKRAGKNVHLGTFATAE